MDWSSVFFCFKAITNKNISHSFALYSCGCFEEIFATGIMIYFFSAHRHEAIFSTPYNGINNAERLNESMHMIEMAKMLVEMYFEHLGMPEDFNKRFKSNSMASIRLVCDNTFYLLGGEHMIVFNALKNIFMQSNIYIPEVWYCFISSAVFLYRQR